MTDSPQKFLPPVTPGTQPFWDACARQELLIQQCDACRQYQFYPRSFCAACGQRDPSWVVACGRGRVRSWTVVRHPVSPAYAAETPYVIALIELAEGPVMMSQLRHGGSLEVTSGMAVQVAFEPWSEHLNLPVFRPDAVAVQHG